MAAASPLRRIGAAMHGFATPGMRMVDEAECVASVALAILIAHRIGAHDIAWAAFTGFVVMRGHVSETMLRGAMRIAGTVSGAALALPVAPLAADSLPVAALAAGPVGAVGLYGMLTARRGYAWLLFGLTFEIVLLGAIEHPGIDIGDLARTRILEVVAGTVACVAVSLASSLTARRRWPAPAAAPAVRIGWNRDAARHAGQAGVTLALLPVLHAAVGMRALEQAGITIMAAMIVPVAGLGASGLAPVTRRPVHRMIGCLGGGALAAAILLVAQGSVPVLVAGTCLGVAIGRHIENGDAAIAYVGLQFTLAILVTLVPDSYADVAIQPALTRLASILIGMALLEPVLLAWHALSPRTAVTPVPARPPGDRPRGGAGAGE